MIKKDKFHSLHVWLSGLAMIVAIIFISPGISAAATLNLISDKQALSIGDEFNVDIKLDTENVGVNATQATLQFSADLVSAVKTDKTGSVFNFWLSEPTIDNTAGTVKFIGGSSSGFSGASLQILRVTFKVKGTGTISMTFNDSAVTASDGSGTNVLSATRGLELKSVSKSEIVQPGPIQIDREPEAAAATPAKPIVTVPLYPNPANWYNVSSNFSASWKLPRDIVAVAAVLNKIPTTLPTVSEGLFDNKSFNALGNGISYLHVRFKNSIGWGTVNHYRIAIDTVPPLPFTIETETGLVSDNPAPIIKYESKDQFSGIESYLIQVDGEPIVKTEKSSMELSPLSPGEHTIKVIAADKAGNTTESSVVIEILPIPSPRILAVSRDVYIGEGGLAVNGSSLPSVIILIELNDLKGQTVYQTQTTADEAGFWSLSIDHPLKKGKYRVLAIARDARGAESLPVSSEEIELKERPVLLIGGIGLTYKWFVVALAIIMILSFALGSWTRKMAKEARQRRILIAERDVNSQLLNVKNDIEKLIAAHKEGGEINKSVESEVNYILKKINTNINKNKDYILENIEEIG